MRSLVRWWRKRRLDKWLYANKPFTNPYACWRCGTVVWSPCDMLLHEKKRRLGLCSEANHSVSLNVGD